MTTTVHYQLIKSLDENVFKDMILFLSYLITHKMFVEFC